MSERSRRKSSDMYGQTDRSNGAFGKSDIEGKVARVAARKREHDRVSNGREHMSQSGDAAEFQMGREHMSECGQRASFKRTDTA